MWCAAAHALGTGDAHQPADLVTPDPQARSAGGVPHLLFPRTDRALVTV